MVGEGEWEWWEEEGGGDCHVGKEVGNEDNNMR